MINDIGFATLFYFYFILKSIFNSIKRKLQINKGKSFKQRKEKPS